MTKFITKILTFDESCGKVVIPWSDAMDSLSWFFRIRFGPAERDGKVVVGNIAFQVDAFCITGRDLYMYATALDTPHGLALASHIAQGVNLSFHPVWLFWLPLGKKHPMAAGISIGSWPQ